MATCLVASSSGGSVTLATTGDLLSTIVVAKQPTVAAASAAAELQYHIERITGALLPIAAADQSVAGARAMVGESSATARLGLHSRDFGPREYLARFHPAGPAAGADRGELILIGRDKPDFRAFDCANARTFVFSVTDRSVAERSCRARMA